MFFFVYILKTQLKGKLPVYERINNKDMSLVAFDKGLNGDLDQAALQNYINRFEKMKELSSFYEELNQQSLQFADNQLGRNKPIHISFPGKFSHPCFSLRATQLIKVLTEPTVV